MKLKGAYILMECLKEQQVDTIFGYPGGQIMPLYDALYDYLGDIKHVLTAHEQGATHAAEGYARATGKVGVCFATSGPGATNTVTGIADAYMDSVPLVVVTGQVPLSSIGKDSFQEVDIVGITLPVTKHNFFIRSVEDIAPSIRRAFEIAKSGRPGPVLVDVPKNFMLALGDYEPQAPVQKEANQPVDVDKIRTIAEALNQAERPVIYAGGGVVISEASKELSELMQKAQIPVTSTLMSLGTVDRRDPLSLGMLGMHGEKEANLAVHHCDLLLTIGARFSDRATGDTSRFAKGSRIMQIDIDESEINKNVGIHTSAIGDIKDALRLLNPMVEAKDRKEWLDKIQGWKRNKNLDPNAFIAENIFHLINQVMGDDVIMTTDVGQHQMWAAMLWPFNNPRSFISSGGLGTMGFGLGAAIGAQVGQPDSRVIHITGDGSFRMNCNELATVASQQLPITTIILKNNTLGMVRQWQKLFFDRRYSSTTLPDVVDYVKLAEAYGLRGHYTRDLGSLQAALEEAKSSGQGRVIVCDIHIDDNVFPIVPPGEAINNQVTEE